QRVVNLDLLTYAGNLRTLAAIEGNSLHVFVRGDIADRPLVDRLLGEHRPVAILNFAAETHVDRSIDGPAAFVQTNVVGTLVLLEAATDYWRSLGREDAARFRFLQVSTDEVYGSMGADGAASESSPFAPNSPYAASKAAADHLVRAFGRTYGLPTLTTHCSNNYGPRQFPEKLIPLAIQRAISGEPIPVYGDGLHVRDWLHVDDHCSAVATVLARGAPGERYNIGADAGMQNLSMVRLICAALDRLRPRADGVSYSSQVTFVPDRPGHDRRYAVDSSKIRTSLGWAPQIELDRGIDLTVEWYLANQAWVRGVSDGSYRLERLGTGDKGREAVR
ncbi:MAG TPA: dTDP-glucose 4,6-dehydratase, partial [Steroidobacteraceae bacterium]|nr:dTDP-glucose 4,6-dehydratase [Steroidobacteraceae bacterium]